MRDRSEQRGLPHHETHEILWSYAGRNVQTFSAIERADRRTFQDGKRTFEPTRVRAFTKEDKRPQKRDVSGASIFRLA